MSNIEFKKESLPISERDDLLEREKQFIAALLLPADASECMVFTTKNLNAWKTALNAKIKGTGAAFSIRRQKDGTIKIWRKS